MAGVKLRRQPAAYHARFREVEPMRRSERANPESVLYPDLARFMERAMKQLGEAA